MIQGTGPASIYVRISEDRDGGGLGVERQEKDCRALAKRNDWEVAKVYEDNDLSASKKGVKRPAYEQLLADIEAGKVRRLIVDKSDRLYRRNTELEHLIDVIEGVGHPVEIAVVKASDLDLSTTNGRMVARILGATAQAEAETIRDRVKRKMQDKIEKGQWKGGPRPFGWESDGNKGLRKVAKEIALLHEAKDRVLAGDSIHRICTDWRDRRSDEWPQGVRSGRGKTIVATTLRDMLVSPRLIGEYDGGVKGHAWDAIFERSEWESLRAMLKARPQGKRRDGGVYMLTGDILKCGRCGGTMYGTPTLGGRWHGGTKETGGTFKPRAVAHYACKGSIKQKTCGKVVMRVSLADDAVMQELVNFLTPYVRMSNDPTDMWEFRSVRKFAKSPSLAVASAAMAKVQESERALAELVAEGQMTKAAYIEAKRKLEPRLTAAKAALDAAEGQAAGLHELASLDPVQFVTRWREMGLAERRRVVLALVSEVRIKPHSNGPKNRPDPDRVEVIYRPELVS